MDTAIFLGAGASKAEGAPLQGELFREYFSSDSFKDSDEEMDRELATFFSEMFQIDVDHDDLAKVIFPTFEEVLGLTDLAALRKEAFRHFDNDNRATNSGRLRFIGQHLVFLVAKVLDAKLRKEAGLHRRLVVALRGADRLRSTAFVSTNYDILIDNALTEERDHGTDLDYGVDFRNFDRPYDWDRPDLDRSVRLFKPHGSLNWLFCPTCNELEITPKEKSVVTRLISDFRGSTCRVCKSVYVPLIVPPTFYKDMNNAFLSAIWNRTDVTLRKVRHIIFCGYSFPDADIHIKYLLKRAQTNRTGPLKFTVINHYEKKDPKDAEHEDGRYKRFLGRGVKYTGLSFGDFAADPIAVVGK
ncbi:MAG TPA: SIR2 family protein [Polyangia bacterium]|nr:SIR2 family protein [Polyangia bacterium]